MVRRGERRPHSEICSVPAERLEAERDLLTALPSLRPAIGKAAITRKVDRLSCIRFGSARYPVPTRLIGQHVAVTEFGGRLVADAATGEVVASHILAAPGEARVLDEHYGGPRPAPRRAARPKTAAEKAFIALGPAAEAFLTGLSCLGQHQAGRRPGRAGCPARRARRPGARPRRWSVRWRSAAGGPPTSGRSWPPWGRDPAA